jgi:hypothetical protein
MNTSQTKIRRIQEANRIAEERFLMSEQAVAQPSTNPVGTKITQPDPTKKPVGTKLPTDYNKAITFLFPDFTTAIIKPPKQDISKAIIEKLGLGAAPTNNVINLVKAGGAQKVCGTNQFNKKVYIFTKPNSDINDWCSMTDINPQYMANNGIFEIPYKPEFVATGNWRSQPAAQPTQPESQVKPTTPTRPATPQKLTNVG